MKQKSALVRFLIVLVGLIVIGLVAVAPTPDGLSGQGKLALVIFLVSIIFWVTEVMPIAITGWAMVGLLPLLGILTPDQTWSASINNAIIFYLCCFAFACFVGRSSIATRLTGMILKWAGTNSSRVLLGFMVVTALISTLMDNLPLCAVMLPIAYGVLDANNTPTGGKSAFAKCIAIGIPWAAAIGGAMTPSGCIINVLAMTLIEQNFGVSISFIQWMAFGVPLAVITIPAGWFALIKIFKPEALSQGAVDSGVRRAEELPKLPRHEVGGIAVMLITLVVWIASSWIPEINITVVSLIALGFMFFPGIEAIRFDDFLTDSPWGMMLLMMAVNVLVAAFHHGCYGMGREHRDGADDRMAARGDHDRPVRDRLHPAQRHPRRSRVRRLDRRAVRDDHRRNGRLDCRNLRDGGLVVGDRPHASARWCAAFVLLQQP